MGFLKWLLGIFFVCVTVHSMEKIPLIPETIVSSFISSYEKGELEKINKDKGIIKELCFNGKESTESPVYLATCGGPGASKTTILENYLSNTKGFVYLDPDQLLLKFMVHTYLSNLTNYDIQKSESYFSLLKNSYEKWRGASNYITNSLLNEAFENKYNIAHGATSTSNAIEFLYKKLKGQGYRISLLLCVSPEDNRLAAVKNRFEEQRIVQSNEEDVITKGKMFYDNFPIYFKWADEMEISYIENFKKGRTVTASFTKENGLKILNEEAFKKVTEEYESHRQKKENTLPPFEDLLN